MIELIGFPNQAADIEETVRDIQRLAAAAQSSTASIKVEEQLPPSALPFDQKAHDLLLQSIDQVTADWMGELAHVRQNSEQVERLERAAKVKADITSLYVLGSAALAEAKRGDDVNAKLVSELDRLSEYHAP